MRGPGWRNGLEPTLVIGQYLDQLDGIGRRLDASVLAGIGTETGGASGSPNPGVPGR